MKFLFVVSKYAWKINWKTHFHRHYSVYNTLNIVQSISQKENGLFNNYFTAPTQLFNIIQGQKRLQKRLLVTKKKIVQRWFWTPSVGICSRTLYALRHTGCAPPLKIRPLEPGQTGSEAVKDSRLSWNLDSAFASASIALCVESRAFTGESTSSNLLRTL